METIPRWTLDPVPGVAEYELPLPEDLSREPTALADAHTKVLAALTGGYMAAAGLEDTGLHAEFTDHGTLRLRYRTDLLDAGAAARIAGYHLTVLTDPDRATLLSEEELRFQLDDLAGPDRELPDRRVHELFEERVLLHPDAVAAVSEAGQWTYAELNSRANRIGRALLARGLRREGVVAVVMERNLDWLASVLGVLKAGGVYLPVEPHFPADRIARTLERAECRLVLTERGSDEHLGGTVRKLFADTAYAEGHADHDLRLPVWPDQLAYIYFTSGSTGEPKGAMCEHAGFLNHVLAKISDLGVGAGRTVAQTAPQCFDISLWQLVSALVVGGRTLLVDQETILDVPRFVDTVARGRVNVLQIVPSYLEAVLAELGQRPRELPDLRCVSVTGEAVKKELVQRWFAAQPGIRLVNAYGLTETSDDTNHEVMDRAPDGDRVPLGRPVANVRVYVVDEDLVPVPLGAPGEIVFSGVCVGRGYVNDPERTKAVFTDDPYRPGERLYRSGDHGRWLPDGKLEFLGRRDSQVKVRGFRVEIGEIENALLRVAGVRDGAVVVVRGTQLVAFCTGPEPVGADAVRERLAVSLPEYMVPAVVHWRESLPLTANGKTDRKTLISLAEQLDSGSCGGSGEPRTAGERRLAGAWAEVLGVPVDRIGRLDHFFDRGGTSLSAVKLAIALDRAITLKDVTRHPVLAELADLLDQHS
ncbi:non-ribosomal peptide synthetase [Streptomyces sp. CA-249302]|uniref:non-ribosomal peptide synthetase n=1 Tax=Streptomyces sp. CA-249302 TaxID=3240058 RepID=UPI003D93F74B